MDDIFRNISLKRLAGALGDLVLPRCCCVCGRPLDAGESQICLECLCDIPYTFFWTCLHNPMADKYNARICSDIPAGVEEAYGCAAALFYYNSESLYRHIPWRLKYGGAIRSGRYFAGMLGERLAASASFSDVDAVVCVPLHWRRRLSRGYNQSEVIAAGIARVMGVPLYPHALRRIRYSRSQTSMTMQQKASNVSDAFRAGAPFEAHHILLVDDTFTTGSTLAACHRALREAFPPSVRISVATLAYVGP